MNIVKQGFEVWTDISDEDAILYELARGASLCTKVKANFMISYILENCYQTY